MKTFVVETFNNLCKITVADAHMKSTGHIMKATNKHFICMCEYLNNVEGCVV